MLKIVTLLTTLLSLHTSDAFSAFVEKDVIFPEEQWESFYTQESYLRQTSFLPALQGAEKYSSVETIATEKRSFNSAKSTEYMAHQNSTFSVIPVAFLFIGCGFISLWREKKFKGFINASVLKKLLNNA